MADAYISEIRVFGFPFVPEGWLACNGQILQITQFPALAAVLGATYGGDGKITFALPDLQGRAPLGSDAQAYPLGKPGGAETQTLTSTQIPPHTHGVRVVGTATQTSPSDASLASPSKAAFAAPGSGGVATMAPQMLGPAGSDQPHDNMPPYLVMNYCINYTGAFPSSG